MSVFDDRLKRLEERFGRRMSEACRDPAKIWMMNVNATMKRGSEVCQLFCVNGQVLFLGMGARGKGAISPSLAQRL
jgi:hypothetical protein